MQIIPAQLQDIREEAPSALVPRKGPIAEKSDMMLCVNIFCSAAEAASQEQQKTRTK